MGCVTGQGGPPSKTQMCKRFLPILACAVALGDSTAFAQFGSPFPTGTGTRYPGTGYPGGRGPMGGGTGIPFPGQRGNTAGQTETVRGAIERISTAQVVLDPGDHRN